MLTWEQEGRNWVSNGYRIELLEPCRWVLLRNEPASVEPVQLAETQTLTLCKREAEILDRASRLSTIRRTLWAELIVALPAFVLVPRMEQWGFFFFLTLLVIVSRAIGFLAGTYMARSHLAVRYLTNHRGPISEDRLTVWPTRHLTRFRHSL